MKDKNTYVFEVFHKVKAQQIVNAIEKIYGVKVERVQKVAVPYKKRRMRTRNTTGKASRYNRVLVSLKKGDTIQGLF